MEMLLKAVEDYNINIAQSYMIGDGDNDVLAEIIVWCKELIKIEEGELLNAVRVMINER